MSLTNSFFHRPPSARLQQCFQSNSLSQTPHTTRSCVRVLLLGLVVYGIAWCTTWACDLELDGVHAQSLTRPQAAIQRVYTYRVRGRVVDQYGRPVAHARIVVDAGPSKTWEDASYF